MTKTARSTPWIVVLGLFLMWPGGLLAQADRTPQTSDGDEGRLSSQAWCSDATTVCWNNGTALAGLRLVFEPQLGVLVQGGDNKFEETNFSSLEKIGLETNLIRGYLGFQLTFIYPSSVTFDDQSPVVVNDDLKNKEDRNVDVEWGYTMGFTFLDGILAVGFGELSYDRRDFKDPDNLPEFSFDDGFVYVNIQPIAAVKSAIKELNGSE